MSERVDHGWTAAYALEAAFGSPDDALPWFLPRSPLGWTREALARWLEAGRPEVIVAGAQNVAGWIESLGCRIPEDIGLALLDLTDASGEYAGLFQNSTLVGRTAVDTLVGLIQRNERGVPAVPLITLLDSTWVAGRTIRSLVGHDSPAAPKTRRVPVEA